MFDLLRPKAKRSEERRTGADAIRRTPFYVAYPFRSPMPIKPVDARGLIEDKLSVFYNRVPKAANTSVVFTLAKMRSGAPTLRGVKKNFRRPAQLIEAEVRRLDSYFKFVFVRNPYSRVLSAYLHKIVHRLERGGCLEPAERNRFRETPSFPEFCRYLADGGLFNNIHWAPQTALMLLPLSKFDFIGKVESFDSDIHTVLSRLGAENPKDFIVTHSRYFTHAQRRLDDYYDAETRGLIGRLYERDFATFGYTTLKLTMTG